MQVLLLKDVDQLGRAGEVKKVSDGYARNFLLPRKLAIAASAAAIQQAEQQRQASSRRQAKALTEAQQFAQQLDGRALTFPARAGESGRLYGSITNADIAEALSAQVGREVDKHKIVLGEPLKELGTHAVTVHLAKEAEAKITVFITREEA
jgi:large subunit ribosomal protein L9